MVGRWSDSLQFSAPEAVRPAVPALAMIVWWGMIMHSCHYVTCSAAVRRCNRHCSRRCRPGSAAQLLIAAIQQAATSSYAGRFSRQRQSGTAHALLPSEPCAGGMRVGGDVSGWGSLQQS